MYFKKNFMVPFLWMGFNCLKAVCNLRNLRRFEKFAAVHSAKDDYSHGVPVRLYQIITSSSAAKTNVNVYISNSLSEYLYKNFKCE